MTQFDKSKGNSESLLTLYPQLIPTVENKCFKKKQWNKLGIDSVLETDSLDKDSLTSPPFKLVKELHYMCPL